MKKILLTSAGFENPKVGKKFLELLNKPAPEAKVLFIPTAARTKEELFYVNESRKELIDAGILKENIIDFNLDRKLTEEEKNTDVIYVCGGNTFHLLDQIKKSGFDATIKEMINNGVVYVGASAGSIILGPDIKLTAEPDPNDVNLQDTTGLNLVDVSVSPHYCDEEKEMVEEWKQKANYKILPLTDKQALLVIEREKEIIE